MHPSDVYVLITFIVATFSASYLIGYSLEISFGLYIGSCGLIVIPCRTYLRAVQVSAHTLPYNV